MGKDINLTTTQTNMKIKSTIILAVSISLSITACNRAPSPAPPPQEISASPDANRDDLREAAIAVEAAKIAAERERQEAADQEQRAKVAEDLQMRQEKRLAAEAAKMEANAGEQARRIAMIADIKEFVDSIEIVDSRIGDVESIKMNEEPVATDSIITSYSGLGITFTGKDQDYFCFSYSEPQFEISLKRTLRGLSLAKVKSKDGIDISQREILSGPQSPATAGGSRSAPASIGRGVIIMDAKFGAESTWRDVKDLLKAKAVDGQIQTRADSGQMGGDPIFGKVKTLKVKYVANGRIVTKEWREGESVSIP